MRRSARHFRTAWGIACLCLLALPALAPMARAATIVPEDLQDYIRQMVLPVTGSESFRRFDSFTWELEGLRVTSGPGSLYTTDREGRTERLALAASGLAWTYTHPIESQRRLFEIQRTHHLDDVAFKPDYFFLECDPESCAQVLAAAFTALRDSPAGEAEPSLLRLHRRAADETASRRRDGDEPGMGPTYEPDHRFVTATIWQAGQERLVQLALDSHEGREVWMGIAGWGDWSYYSAATRASGTPAEELERRPDAVRRDYDLVSLKGGVQMATTESELLTGNLTAQLRARRDLRRLTLSLSGLGEHRGPLRRSKGSRLVMRSITDDARRELKWTPTGPVSGVIDLIDPVGAGDLLTLSIQYETRDAIKKVEGSYYYVDRDGWLPFTDFGDLIQPFDLTVSTPGKFQILCVGRQSGARTREELATARCAPQAPVVFPTTIFGIYKEYPASVKATRQDGTAIPVITYIDRDTVGTMPTMKGAPAAADQAAMALNLYRDVFRVDYPFERLDLVNAPQGFSGQAPSAIVYLGDPTFLSEGRLGSAYGGGVTRFKSGLVPHEVAHQWWGSLVTAANRRSYWFVESLAEYSSALFLEAARGAKGYLDSVQDWRLDALREEGWWSVEDNAGIYTKGAYLFHIMRSTWGDERFIGFLRALAGEMQGKAITTRDIQRVAESVFGLKMEWFFDQWVRGAGIPEFTFTHKVAREQDGGWSVEAQIDQRVMVTTKWPARELLPDVYFQGAAVITMVGRSGKEYRKKYALTGARTAIREKLPEEPVSVILNKYGEMLAYDVNTKGAS